MADLSYEALVPEPQPDDLCYAFCGKMVYYPGRFPTLREVPWTGDAVIRRVFFGRRDGRACWAWETTESRGEGWLDLRQLFFSLDEAGALWAGRGNQILLWDKNHSFCGVCGGPTRRVEGEWSRICDSCGHTSWPRLSPAVIALVHRGDQVLLAHNAKMPPQFLSLVAGFVEAGESLEEAVVREVREEVGLEIHPPRYVTSQSWPFPDALMAGFVAEHRSGEPTPDGREITRAQWYGRGEAPYLPRAGSIARKLLRIFWNDPEL